MFQFQFEILKNRPYGFDEAALVGSQADDRTGHGLRPAERLLPAPLGRSTSCAHSGLCRPRVRGRPYTIGVHR
jgi:hypothetical protein